MSPQSPSGAEVGALLALAERVEAGKGCDNALDVEVEVALFVPDATTVAVRANAAGSKVIFRRANGNEETCWADDWTMSHRRPLTAATLRARATTIRSTTHDE